MKITLSHTTKMPCASYSIPATVCKTGAKLAKIPNSVCSHCYALSNHYRFGNVRRSLANRLAAIDSPDWVAVMAAIIETEGNPYFRWHDSGDIQSVEHLDKIAQIAQRLPTVRFWLPTREKQFVLGWLAEHPEGFPDNLIIRASATLVNGPKPSWWPLTHTVHTDTSAVTCPAKQQNGKCKLCRACWDKSIQNTAFPLTARLFTPKKQDTTV